jgi:hypothetical protein
LKTEFLKGIRILLFQRVERNSSSERTGGIVHPEGNFHAILEGGKGCFASRNVIPGRPAHRILPHQTDSRVVAQFVLLPNDFLIHFRRGITTDSRAAELEKKLPEVDEINFAPRVKVPTLMVNGRCDHFFPLETSQNVINDFWGHLKKTNVTPC